MPHIRNFETLATDDLRRDALLVAEAGYAAIDTAEALARTLRIEGGALIAGERSYKISGRRVFFVGVGKCAFAAAGAVEKLLGARLAGGIALDPSEVGTGVHGVIERIVGTHPLPSDTNENATNRIMELLSACTQDDFVIVLVSGGGSTLLCLHEAPMTCADEGMLFSKLTARGATIQEINTVRKHVSRARGGGLAAAAHPAEVLSLIVSDVPGNDSASIASGPTVLDASTADDARAVLARYGISEAPALLETPKDPGVFERVTNLLFLTNGDALRAMAEEAARLGYAATVVTDRLTGDARAAGTAIAEKLHGAPAKSAFLYAGETTVAISGAHGKGGRNQELALSAGAAVHDGEVVLAFASDGRDNSDHAGAIADASLRAGGEPIDQFLDEHRSYEFFEKAGSALITGYTGSNVSDLIIALKQ